MKYGGVLGFVCCVPTCCIMGYVYVVCCVLCRVCHLFMFWWVIVVCCAGDVWCGRSVFCGVVMGCVVLPYEILVYGDVCSVL